MRLTIALLLAISLCACSSRKTPRYRVDVPRVPSSEKRAAISKMVLVVDHPTQTYIHVPNAKTAKGLVGAGVGAATGAGFTALVAAPSGPAAPFVATAIAPVAIIGGAIVGGVSGAETSKPSKADQATGDRMAEMKQARLDLNKVMRDALISRAYSTGRNVYVPRTTIIPDKKGRRDYSSWSSHVDTAFQADVLYCGLKMSRPKKLGTNGFVVLRTRLVNVSTGKVIYESITEHVSKPRQFIDWSKDNCAPLLAELDAGTKSLAQESYDRLFPSNSNAVIHANTRR